VGAHGAGEVGVPGCHCPWGQVGGCPCPRGAGAAPTLDGEGGPVLRLPARGVGPAHVHPLRAPRQLRHPAGTQPGCGTPRGAGGRSPPPRPPSLPQHPVPHAVGGGQLPAVLQPLQACPGVSGDGAGEFSGAAHPLDEAPRCHPDSQGATTAVLTVTSIPWAGCKALMVPGGTGIPGARRPRCGVGGLTMDGHAGEGLGGADAVGDEAAVGAGVGRQRRADAEEASAVDDACREAAVDLVPSVEQRRGAMGQALHLQRVTGTHRGLLRQAGGVRRRCGGGWSISTRPQPGWGNEWVNRARRTSVGGSGWRWRWARVRMDQR